MYAHIPSLILFGLIVSAPGWRRLVWHAAAALALVVLAFGWATGWRFSLVAPGGDADIGAGIVLYYGIAGVAPALAARAVSLWARRLGHPRPWSLWIEALCFLGGPAAVEFLLVAR